MKYETLVLGIDAAWTASEPSGLALVGRVNGVWSCLGLWPSYGHLINFDAQQGTDWSEKPVGALPAAASIIAAAERVAGRSPDIVVADIPLAKSDIIGRREADNAISRHWGRVKCGTHSPSSSRPGAISRAIRDGFGAKGYRLITLRRPERPERVLLETYPHPTAMALVKAPERVPYKAAKARKYWPDATRVERREKLLAGWANVIGQLTRRVAGLDVLTAWQPVWPERSAAALKRWEDVLDALLCALAGMAFADDAAQSFGDDDAAIWLPREAWIHLQGLR